MNNLSVIDNESLKDDMEHNFLEGLVKNKSKVAIYLRGGIKLQGIQIRDFSQHAILTTDYAGGNLQLIYKRNISTILPLDNM